MRLFLHYEKQEQAVSNQALRLYFCRFAPALFQVVAYFPQVSFKCPNIYIVKRFYDMQKLFVKNNQDIVTICLAN